MRLDTRNVALALGGIVIGRNRVAAPGPGHSPRDRSLVVKIDDNVADGFVVFSHAGDSWQDCKRHVRQCLGLPEWQAGDEQDRRIGRASIKRWDRQPEGPQPLTEDDITRINRARHILSGAGDVRGTAAQEYLEKHRKLILTAELAKVLRFHPECPWRDENSGKTILIPALVAPFSQIDDNTITGVHRIRLDQPGRWPKVDRRMFGVVLRAAVKLAPIKDGTLVIGEGIETAASAIQFGIASAAWALGSAGGISFFPIIPGVRRLLILAESDDTNERAIKMLKQRWENASFCKIQIVRSRVGSDLNDALIAQTACKDQK
jgi:Toprim domain-containing protein